MQAMSEAIDAEYCNPWDQYGIPSTGFIDGTTTELMLAGLFAWCPGKAAWPRQRAQASDFGGLGSGSLPGRRAAWQGCIQTSH